MFKKIFLIPGIAIVLLIAVLLVNTFITKPWPDKTSNKELLPLPDSAIQHMSQAVQIPTISYSDSTAIDTVAFKAFGQFIERAYPLVHQHLSKTVINQFSFVFEWKGRNDSLPPFILMSHYDVVPVEEATIDNWKAPPFSGAVRDSCIWGRGSIDNKSGVIARLEATEYLLRKGFVPERTIYLCFGHDEEANGGSADLVVRYLENEKVRAEMVLDEGGEISVEKTKEVKRPIALIGVAEKGYASFELSVEKEGGHSMIPAKETALDILAAALLRIKNDLPPARLTAPVKELLNRIGPSSEIFVNRMAACNMWLFRDFAKSVLSSKPEGNAMVRTTIVPTIFKSGVKDNVIPGEASAIINCRILPGETVQLVEKYLQKTINDSRVKIMSFGRINTDPTTTTSINSPAFRRVENAIYKNVQHVIPAPHLMPGRTDSRYYRRISDGVVNFLPGIDSKGYHGVNERLPISDLRRCISFISTIIEDGNSSIR